MFFYDCFGGDKIGGVWLPGIRAPKPFKVRERYSSAPVHQVGICDIPVRHSPDYHSQNKKGGKVSDVVLNDVAIIAEIGRMGQGLVKSVIVHQK